MIEQQIEQSFIDKLSDLKYVYRPEIMNRAGLEQNFREKFEELNRVHLTDAEFAILLDDGRMAEKSLCGILCPGVAPRDGMRRPVGARK